MSVALPKIEVVKAAQSTAAASRVERLDQHGDEANVLKLFTPKNLSFSLWKTSNRGNDGNRSRD